MASVVFPRSHPRKLAPVALALCLLAAGCGGSSHSTAGTKGVAGEGFRIRVPADWQVRHRARTVEARSGEALVSVTVFPLPRPFDPALWAKAVAELDRVAQQLASRESALLTTSETRQIGGLQARAYVIEHNGAEERIGFVLRGRIEYELFCRGSGGACDTLFATFRLS